jgi:hypothetical protein
MTDQTPRAKRLATESKSTPPVSAILFEPRKARACFAFAHGAAQACTCFHGTIAWGESIANA